MHNKANKKRGRKMIQLFVQLAVVGWREGWGGRGGMV
jgi:hypothetical protein